MAGITWGAFAKAWSMGKAGGGQTGSFRPRHRPQPGPILDSQTSGRNLRRFGPAPLSAQRGKPREGAGHGGRGWGRKVLRGCVMGRDGGVPRVALGK